MLATQRFESVPRAPFEWGLPLQWAYCAAFTKRGSCLLKYFSHSSWEQTNKLLPIWIQMALDHRTCPRRVNTKGQIDALGRAIGPQSGIIRAEALPPPPAFFGNSLSSSCSAHNSTSVCPSDSSLSFMHKVLANGPSCLWEHHNFPGSAWAVETGVFQGWFQFSFVAQ